MTQCYKGGHDFPYEDETGAYCEEHGVTFIWKHPTPATRPPAARPSAPPTPDSAVAAGGDAPVAGELDAEGARRIGSRRRAR